MNQENPNAQSNAEDPRRTIMLVYGMFPNGQPFWVFTAVKPNKQQAFMAAHKEGALDLYNFSEFGEIIVSGEGKSPPDEITLKVAEMYQTDPSTLFKNIKDENAAAAAEKAEQKK
jgi:hypothetical protein